MRIKKIKVYQYDELSDEAKEKALESLYDINVDYAWWDFDGLTGLSEEEMKEAGIDHYPDEGIFGYEDKYFSIDREWYLDLKDCFVPDRKLFLKWLGIPQELHERTSYSIYTPSGRNKSTVIKIELEPKYIEVNGEYETKVPITTEESDIITRAEQKFHNKIQDCLHLLRKDYEYRTSKEAIEETIRINEYEFTEDGRLA